MYICIVEMYALSHYSTMTMIRLSDIVTLSAVLNLKEVCSQAGLSYSTMFTKIRKAKSGEPHRSELSVTESEKFMAALTTFGITVDVELLRKQRTNEATKVEMRA